MLGDVLTTLSANDPRDRRLSNAVSVRQINMVSTFSSGLPNGSDLIVCQGYITSRLGSPPFSVHVSKIVGLRPQEQVVRSDARRVVAGVKDVQSLRDWAVGPNPGKFVRRYRLSVEPEQTVTFSARTARRGFCKNSNPNPTPCCLVYFSPETLLIVSKGKNRPALPATRLLRGANRMKRFPTSTAFKHDRKPFSRHYAHLQGEYTTSVGVV